MDVIDLKAKQQRLLALLPDDQNWVPPESATELKLRRYQPALEKALQKIKILVSQTDQLSIEPAKFAQEKGRITFGEGDLVGGTTDLASAPRDTTKPRLDSEWLGRLDKNGRPYSFDEVRSPKRFAAIGGAFISGRPQPGIRCCLLPAHRLRRVNLPCTMLIRWRCKCHSLARSTSRHQTLQHVLPESVPSRLIPKPLLPELSQFQGPPRVGKTAISREPLSIDFSYFSCRREAST